jgi:hypothetical protein
MLLSPPVLPLKKNSMTYLPPPATLPHQPSFLDYALIHHQAVTWSRNASVRLLSATDFPIVHSPGAYPWRHPQGIMRGSVTKAPSLGVHAVIVNELSLSGGCEGS